MRHRLIADRLVLSATVLAAGLAVPSFPAVATPILCASPTQVDFGKVLVGGSATGAISARNCGPDGTLSGTFGGSAGSPDFQSSAAQPFSGLGAGASTQRSYVYAPAARGSDTGKVSVTATVGGVLTRKTIDLAGQGVAPVEQVFSTDAPLTRLGTSSNASVVVWNAGDGNQAGAGLGNLAGQVGNSAAGLLGAGGAINLPDDVQAVFNYAFAPVGRGSVSTIVGVTFSNGSANGTNKSESLDVTLNGLGAGPAYAGPSSLDLGEHLAGETATLAFDIFNGTPDDPSGDVTALSLLGFDIGGPGGLYFKLLGFTPIVLQAGDKASFTVSYTAPSTPGDYLPTLTFFTDEGAAFGVHGQDFAIDLHGGTRSIAVPEPGTAALVTLPLALLLRSRRRETAG